MDGGMFGGLLSRAAESGRKLLPLLAKGGVPFRVIWYSMLHPTQVDLLLRNSQAVVEAERRRQEAEKQLARVAFDQLGRFEAVPISDAEEMPIDERREALFGATSYIRSPVWIKDDSPDAKSLLAYWFKQGVLQQIHEMQTIEKEWERLMSRDLHIFRGLPSYEVEIADHPYIQRMHPFILIARPNRNVIPAGKDARSHILGLFFRWVEHLTGDGMKTSFAVRRAFVPDGGSLAYVRGTFHFTGIVPFEAIEKAKNKADTQEILPSARDYYLDRELIVAEHGDSVVIVMTGVPRRDLISGAPYREHVRKWLEGFQLARPLEGGLQPRSF